MTLIAAAEAARKQKEYEEEQARLQAIENEKQNNYNQTGYYETNSERADREKREYEEEQERLRLEEEARQRALQEEREANLLKLVLWS